MSLDLSKIIKVSFRESQYLKQVTSKKQIYLHHTAGNSSGVNVAKFWNGNEDRIATSFIISGNVKDSVSGEKDGDIIECFDTQYWAYHLGLKREVFSERKIPYQSLDKISIGIEICCWGQLTKQLDGTYRNYLNHIVPSNEVIELETAFKGYKYWHNYTDAQVESVKNLLQYLCKKYQISSLYNSDIFAVTDRALKGENGIFTHNSVRKDKVDIYPHPKIIDVLKNL